MSTPYWGQLPPPKAVQAKAYRLSDDLTTGGDRPQSLDGAVQAQPQSNRVSVQTTKSDALTDSTMSPFVSPTASSFQGGLAPRPPSLPYGANQYPPELAENRRRRRSRNQDSDHDYSAPSGPPPPAAPEVPRAPPISYRHSSGSGPAHAYPPGPPRPSRQMDADEYRSSPTSGGLSEDHPVLDRARTTLAANAASRDQGHGQSQRNSTDPALARNMSMRDETGGHKRRASAADQVLQYRNNRRPLANHPTDRSKMFAVDRSPLQRLELTLDSISKEDKRARAEAAERAARERAAGPATAAVAAPATGPAPAQQADRSLTSQQARYQQTQPSTPGQEESKPNSLAPVTPTRAAQGVAIQHGPLSQNPPEEGRRYTANQKSPRAQAPESRIPIPSSGAQQSGIPQRNLSFRERAAKNEMKLANGLDGPSSTIEASSPAKSPMSGVALIRSGTNKLKKNPPADPWPERSEELLPPVQMRTGPAPRKVREGGPAAAVAVAHRSAGAPGRVEPNVQPRRLADDYDDDYQVSTPPAVAKLVKSASQRKADQILGLGPSYQPPANGTRGSPGLVNNGPAPGAVAAFAVGTAVPASAASRLHARRDARSDSDTDEESHHVSGYIYRARDKLQPGMGIFKPTPYLDEWKTATVGTLDGAHLDLDDVQPVADGDRATPWWEGSKRRGSMAARPKKAEAFKGEYDDTNAPTRFKPPLYLKCGPLLRYCGLRYERVPSRSAQDGAGTVVDKEIWRGSVMIVTTDADSSYDIAPTLRLFVQPIELLPPPPREIQGDEPLAPEYVDPIAGHPKLGRKGETLYVRPVDHLDEAKDLSRDETDNGLFEKSKSPSDMPLGKGVVDPPGSFAARRKRADIDGEKAGKYKDVRGFRLHAERGYTFWRFNIEVELGEKQQRIAYRINRGPSTGFWVPAKGQAMNIMFHSCNGFSMTVNPDQFSGPDPMWRDVLNSHQSQPFHVMIGGGDQIYNDKCMQETKLFREWLMIKNPLHKHNAPFTTEMQNELETFYLERYAMWFSQGLFGMANSQIPMVNMYDDHDIIDGFGSYPHHFMNSPVFSGLGNVAFKYYMLFQHQSTVEETEKTEPSWTLGERPGPYITERSRSLFMHLGAKVALLAVDARTERTREDVIREDTWNKIIDRCYAEIDKGKTEHLLVLLGVPVAYPRLVWLENILTSRMLDPVKALGKLGLFGGFLNKFDGGVEVLDDLDDHWTAKNHKHERALIMEDLQDLAASKSVRITILSGDVHLAAIGQFYSNPKLGHVKHKDFRYIPNVISSAIVNTPPPDLMADILNKRNKVHHFDKETDEDMIPIFEHGVDGKPRNNKRLLPHRNWCSIREYVPGNTPPHTPDLSEHDFTPLDTPPGVANGGGGSGPVSLFRRLSKSRNRGPSFHGPDGVHDRSRPPISGGLLRTLSRRAGIASADEVGNHQQKPPGLLTRTLSGSSISGRFGGLFRRRSSIKKHDDGGINGNWGAETDEDDSYSYDPQHRGGGVGLRGGLGPAGHHHQSVSGSDTNDDDNGEGYSREYADGDESYFSVKAAAATARDHSHNDKPLPPDPAPSPPAAAMMSGAVPAAPMVGMPKAAPGPGDAAPEQDFAPRPFHRAPTGLSVKQRKRAEDFVVNLEGGLEVCLNVEISPRDPGGSTVPYRLIVPKLWYEDLPEDVQNAGAATASANPPNPAAPSGIKRFISLRRGASK
ncbi:hypothetical protein B0T26DRAFT_746717 [Lasiosphaeria miniovina]|uniref:PhoD-like phosphatase domain-containing protein n=1 Tax=Lasiosphaeria miniovina TaxID=1954250 RepID=A0AA40BII6_9PEZI|nr:uncharacterized protein B0T26DRAFT_746717 [Lasiosphaeria miniovina]KAK0734865.1 hypothetical protein B0T26DRAFT_746717 [Lasiosphaeria miniovina]